MTDSFYGRFTGNLNCGTYLDISNVRNGTMHLYADLAGGWYTWAGPWTVSGIYHSLGYERGGVETSFINSSGNSVSNEYSWKQFNSTSASWVREAADYNVTVYSYEDANINGAFRTAQANCVFLIPHLAGAITGLTATRVSDNSVSLSWTKPGTAIDGVMVQVAIDGGSWSNVATLGDASSYQYTQATADHAYKFRVRATYMNSSGSWAESSTVTMTPAAPTSITTAAAGGTNIDVTLTNPSPVATKVQYQVSTDGGSTWGATQDSASLTSFSVSASGTVKIRVRNYNATGTSDWLESDVIVTITPPAAPTLLSPSSNVINMSDGSVTFEWVHNALDGSSQTAAQLAYSTDGGSTWTTQTLTTEQSYTVSPIPWAAGTLVTWRVRTKGADASYGDWAQAITFDVFTAPTLNITSPGATITGMPISLTAAYYDMAGFTCQAATVSLTKDGRTLYSEAGTISEVGGVTTITSSLDVSEFLPENGETYTVVVTARSSSSLQTSANATFTVDFVEPQAGELNITNDPETGYASLLATFDNHASDVEYSGDTNEQFDSTEGYVRSLTVEGKSEKWNQQVIDGSFEAINYWEKAGNTAAFDRSASGNVLKLTMTESGVKSTRPNVRNPANAVNVTIGHKLYLLADVKVTTSTAQSSVDFALWTGVYSPSAIACDGQWHRFEKIVTATDATANRNTLYISQNIDVFTAGDTIEYRGAVAIDLTAIFGSGNEPATVDAFKATDVYKAKLAAGELYDYDAGSLVSIEGAGVRGRNLATTAVYKQDYVIGGSGAESAATDYIITDAVPVEAGATYAGSYSHADPSSTDPLRVGIYTSSMAFISRPVINDSTTTITMPSNAAFVRFSYATAGSNALTDVMFSKGSTPAPYEPYRGATITTSLRSAGSVHDTLTADADSWTVERRVGVVDLGTLTWNYDISIPRFYTTDISALIKPPQSGGAFPNILSNMYVAETFDGLYTIRKANLTAAVSTSGNLSVINTAYSTPADFKTAMSGVYLFYELAEPTTDPETSMSTIEIGSAFTVATDLDTTFEMTTWDGSADAVSISVSRVNADGLTPLITDGASGSGVVDKYAPLNTPYQYAVTTKASTQAVKTVYIDNIIESDYWFAYWGENIASAKWNPDNGGIQVTRPQKTRVYYAGRRDPVSYDGHAVALTETPSWMFIGKDEVDAFVQLIEDGGRGIYKSCDGWVYHADFDLTMTPRYTAIGYYGGASLGITRIAGERL